MMKSERRDKKQEALKEEIKQVAYRLMAEQGSAGLAIRSVARALDLTPAALYYYFSSQDALITALVVDSYNHLADHLEQTRHEQAGQPAATQLLTVALAYREWAVARPVEFELLFGNPIPGYQAPREVTVPAVVRTYRVLVELFGQAEAEGLASPLPQYRQVPAEMHEEIARINQQGAYSVSDLAFYLTAVFWTRMQGLILPELTHHLQPTVGKVDLFYRLEMENILRTVGLTL